VSEIEIILWSEQMILIYNIPGLLMVLGAGLGGFVVSILIASLDEKGAFPGAAAAGSFGLICIVADLWYRLRQPEESTGRKLFSPSVGGMLYWIPIWLAGGLFGLFGCIRILTGGK
jgi:hypothetical protein